jgi:hypothetical protein
MNLDTRTLGEVADLLRNGSITAADADTYIAEWNAGPCRFTLAERIGTSIVQLPKCGDCGAIRRDHTNTHRFVE